MVEIYQQELDDGAKLIILRGVGDVGDKNDIDTFLDHLRSQTSTCTFVQKDYDNHKVVITGIDKLDYRPLCEN